ncbi:hypothetical protein KY330_04740 [Candidatus Woesearchaeota archaeon]|nr:hypothetical protein [Candidatus Woesearchaeota archaeon]
MGIDNYTNRLYAAVFAGGLALSPLSYAGPRPASYELRLQELNQKRSPLERLVQDLNPKKAEELNASKKFNEAISYLQPRLNRILSLYNMEGLKRADEGVRKSLALAFNEYGGAFLKLGKIGFAEPQLKRGLELFPLGPLYKNLMLINIKRKDFKCALSYANGYLEHVNPNDDGMIKLRDRLKNL